MEIDHALAEALEGNVAAVLGHGRPDAGLEQFLDGFDRLFVLGREELVPLAAVGSLRCLGDRGAGEIVLHDDAENGRLQMLPFALALGHADEIGAEEHAPDALELEQACGKGRGLARLGIEKLQGAVREHRPARKEFQGRGIWCGFGLNEHGSNGRLRGQLRTILANTWAWAPESQGWPSGSPW